MYTISYAIYLQSSCRGRRVRSFLATPSDPAPRAARAERRSETRQARRPKARSLTQQGRSDPSPRRASEPPVRTRTHQMDETERASRALRGRIGAHRLHATHDPRETTKAARSAFWLSFEREVDPDGLLEPEERARRAAHARAAHFARLAYLSARARAARSAQEPR